MLLGWGCLGILVIIILLCQLVSDNKDLQYQKLSKDKLQKELDKKEGEILRLNHFILYFNKPKTTNRKTDDSKLRYQQGFREGEAQGFKFGDSEGFTRGFNQGHERGREYQINHPDEKIEVKINETT